MRARGFLTQRGHRSAWSIVTASAEELGSPEPGPLVFLGLPKNCSVGVEDLAHLDQFVSALIAARRFLGEERMRLEDSRGIELAGPPPVRSDGPSGDEEV